MPAATMKTDVRVQSCPVGASLPVEVLVAAAHAAAGSASDITST